MNQIKKIKSTISSKSKNILEKILEIDDIELDDIELDSNVKCEDRFEIPICLISVDFENVPHLVKVFNEEKVNPETIGIIKEILGEYTLEENPGIYIMDIGIHAWKENYPESVEYEFELTFENIKEISIEPK